MIVTPSWSDNIEFSSFPSRGRCCPSARINSAFMLPGLIRTSECNGIWEDFSGNKYITKKILEITNTTTAAYRIQYVIHDLFPRSTRFQAEFLCNFLTNWIRCWVSLWLRIFSNNNLLSSLSSNHCSKVNRSSSESSPCKSFTIK